jgi:hypothetical protein
MLQHNATPQLTDNVSSFLAAQSTADRQSDVSASVLTDSCTTIVTGELLYMAMSMDSARSFKQPYCLKGP